MAGVSTSMKRDMSFAVGTFQIYKTICIIKLSKQGYITIGITAIGTSLEYLNQAFTRFTVPSLVHQSSDFRAVALIHFTANNHQSSDSTLGNKYYECFKMNYIILIIEHYAFWILLFYRMFRIGLRNSLWLRLPCAHIEKPNASF